MCFSARISFLASGLLLAIGVATLRLVKENRQYMFAMMPLLFSIQQAIEGIVWLTQGNPSMIHTWAVYAFSIFALIIWPTWIPMSVFLLENNSNKKKIIGGLTLLGIAISLYFLNNFIKEGVSVKEISSHLYYQFKLPDYVQWYTSGLYLIATIGPLFVSSISHMWILGIIFLASYFITFALWKLWLFSVWCFFVAILSIMIYGIMYQITKVKQ